MAKQKAKTRKIVTKRFKITKKGKVLKKATNISHLKRNDSKTAKYRKKRESEASKSFSKKVKKMIVK